VVCFIGMLAAVVIGGGLGKLAERLVSWRRFLLVGLAVVAVVVVGALSIPSYIEPALVPAIVMALVLERWTRHGAVVDGPLSSTWRGVVIGVVNVVAVGLTIGLCLALDPSPGQGVSFEAVWIHRPPPGMVALFTMFIGFVPGLLAGAALGGLTGMLADRSPLTRVAILTGAALAVVASLGAWTHNTQLILVAAVPTLISAIVLERWTRHPVELPSARVVA
jgi:hypothetical protein